jgi:hypothetical protein
MPLYTFLQSLINVLVEIANKMGLQKKSYVKISWHSLDHDNIHVLVM